VKRALKILAIALAAVVLAIAVLVVATMSGGKPIVDGEQLPGGTVTVKDGFTSAFMLDAGDGAVVFMDACRDPKGAAVLAALARRGAGPDAVKAVFLTHGHTDHTGAIPLFKNAAIMALADEVALIEGRAAPGSPISALRGKPKPTGLRVTRALADGETVTVGTLTVRVFAVPGHTAGSAAYLARGTLFLGDAADASSSGDVRSARWLFSESAGRAAASLESLSKRLAPDADGVKALAFAHSGPLAGFAPLAAFRAK